MELHADVDARNASGLTPLFYAVDKAHISTIELLAQYGADLFAENASHETPFDWADSDEVRAVLQHFAEGGAAHSSPEASYSYSSSDGDGDG